jgi:hypothetical protein
MTITNAAGMLGGAHSGSSFSPSEVGSGALS